MRIACSRMRWSTIAVKHSMSCSGTRWARSERSRWMLARLTMRQRASRSRSPSACACATGAAKDGCATNWHASRRCEAVRTPDGPCWESRRVSLKNAATRRWAKPVTDCGGARVCSSHEITQGGTVPRYIIERTVGQLTREELDVASRRSIAAISEIPGVVWIRSYVSEAEGKIYCEYDAPSPEAVREHARRAGLP